MSAAKYLVRNDGVVFGFSETLAKNPKFKVVMGLPAQHLDALKAAKEDEDLRRGRAAKTEEEGERATRDLLAAKREEQEQKIADAQKALASTSAEDTADSTLQTDEFVLAGATKSDLVRYAKLRFSVDLDGTKHIAKLRSDVRALLDAETKG